MQEYYGESKLKDAGFSKITEELGDLIGYKNIEIGGVCFEAKVYYYTDKGRTDPKYHGSVDVDGLKLGDTELFYLFSEEQCERIAKEVMDMPVVDKLNPSDQSAGEAVTIGETVIFVDYDYSPAEPQTHEYPGSDASFELTKVVCSGVDITEALDEDSMGHLADKVAEQLFSQENTVERSARRRMR